jgi:hypothetical protein
MASMEIWLIGVYEYCGSMHSGQVKKTKNVNILIDCLLPTNALDVDFI